MKAIYRGTVVESSLPLDSTVFQQEKKPEKPTTPAKEKARRTGTAKKR